MKKTLVTGGAGFIGSHLVERLLKDNYKVVVLDNLSTGRLENIAHLKNNSKLKIVKIDIKNLKNIRPYFKNIDCVFHLAALADIVPSIVRPLEYHRNNVDGTVNVLEASRLSDVKKFIYAASSSCYGIPDKYPTPETAEIRPQYPYALTKFLGEQCVLHWSNVYNLPIISLRLFNVYGPRSRTSGAYGAVFGVFLAQKLHNKPFTVVGDGSQKRDFIFVTDVCDAFVGAAKSRIKNEIFNVGFGQPQSINKLVKLLKGEVVYLPKRPGEPDCTWADISRIRKNLKWKPKISFNQGVRIMLRNIDYWHNAPLWTKKRIKEATRNWFKYLSK